MQQETEEVPPEAEAGEAGWIFIPKMMENVNFRKKPRNKNPRM